MNKLEDAAFQSAGRTFIIEDSSRILGDAQECHAGTVFFAKKFGKTNTKGTGMRNMTWYSMYVYMYLLFVFIYIYIYIYLYLYLHIQPKLCVHLGVCIHLQPRTTRICSCTSFA